MILFNQFISPLAILWAISFMAIPYACCNHPREAAIPVTDTDEAFTVASIDTSMILRTIAFGSCNKEYLDQSYWDNIRSTDPDLWIWLGDNVYGDTENMTKLARKYRKVSENEYYREFRRSIPVIGTWDDHDYGANNSGKEYPKRQESAELLLDFLDVPPDAPQRNREGIYSTYLFGPEDKRVRFILLDARYFRDPLIPGENGYEPDPKGTILGEAQWNWLEEILNKKDADIYFIASGIQILPFQHQYEKWANFPNERIRLLEMIDSLSLQNCILLSGDRHIAEVSMWTGPANNTPIYEITSSGLTHAYEDIQGEPNELRISPLVSRKNFGTVEIDWSTTPPTLLLQIRDIETEILYEKEI